MKDLLVRGYAVRTQYGSPMKFLLIGEGHYRSKISAAASTNACLSFSSAGTFGDRKVLKGHWSQSLHQ